MLQLCAFTLAALPCHALVSDARADTSVTMLASAESPSAFSTILTDDEKQWLAAHPVIRVGTDPAWPPFSLSTHGKGFEGIDIDVLTRIATLLGVRVEFIDTPSWSATWDRFLKREVDITTGTAETPERRAHAAFSTPYASFPVALITRADAPFLVGLDSFTSRTLAAPRGHVTTMRLQEEFPSIKLLLTDTSTEAMTAVSQGRADGCIDNLASASHIISSEGLTNLKIAGLTEFRFELRFAVRKDWPELAVLIDKALAGLNHAERARIFDNWITVDYDQAINWQSVRRSALAVSAFGAILLAFAMFWNRRLARELAERRAVEESLREREAELRRTHAKLQALNDEKDMMIKMAAHDLNNPLTSILLLCDDTQGALPMNDTERFGEVRTCADRMNRLIRNLLHVENRGHETDWLHPSRVDAGKVIARVVERYKRSAFAKNLTLAAENLSPRESVIEVDEDAFDQILDNLISNAIKYSRDGGHVTVRTLRDNGLIRLEVQDSGAGIPEHERHMLFKRFSRLSTKPTAGESSFGLGLAIVKSLAERMKGSVRCENHRDGGALFIVEFPAST